MGRIQDSGQGIRIDSDGYAVDGYDVVAYFSLPPDVPAIRGTPAYSREWRGAVWLFSSNENLEAFGKNPHEFTPAYGGYGAEGMAEERLVRSDPGVWAVVDGRLYLFQNEKEREAWRRDPIAAIEAADRNWPGQLAELRNR